MSEVRPDTIKLGQPVHLRTDASRRLGYIVGLLLTGQPVALVRWANAAPTFESLQNLIDAHQFSRL